MSLFVLSDTHLSLSLPKPMDIFGPRWKDHASRIEENWKSVVGENDTVVVGGDVSWGMSLDEAREDLLFLDRLPGKKLIGRGNHDFWWPTMAKLARFFEENGINTLNVLFNNAYKVENFIVCGARGWYSDRKNAPENCDFSKIVARENGRLRLSLGCGKKLYEKAKEEGGDPEMIAFFHFPPVFGDFVCREFTDTLSEFGIKKVYYGHIHGAEDVISPFEYEGIRYFISSCDHVAFTPLLVR